MGTAAIQGVEGVVTNIVFLPPCIIMVKGTSTDLNIVSSDSLRIRHYILDPPDILSEMYCRDTVRIWGLGVPSPDR